MTQSACRRLLWLCAAAAGLAWLPAAAGSGSGLGPGERVDFAAESPSAEARHVADWALHSGDSQGLPFVVVDKAGWRVFVFDGQGRLKGAAPALLGLALGDESVPGIGQRTMASIRPEERTTPAGRFVASLEKSLNGADILWVDYDTAIAMHPVAATVAKERRLERLASRTASDHRITYGCINVPGAFFHAVVAPLFRASSGIVYVLPETRSARAMFGSYDLAPGMTRTSAQPGSPR